MKNFAIPNVLWLIFIWALFVAAANAQGANAQTFGKGHKIVLHSRMALSQDQNRAMREFRGKAGYFGAVAFHKGGAIHFWVRNYHDLETARRFAVGGCRRIATTEGRDPNLCELYASAIPKNMEPSTARAGGIGEEAFEVLTGEYRKEQKNGRFGAFAISGMANWGYTSGREREADAIGSAVASCEAAADREIAGWSNEARGEISRLNLDRCKVVHLTRP